MAVRPETSGMVYNIQRFSIHDGPGIRTTVFLKGCPLRCFWCQNPESQRSRPELFVTAEKCLNCGRCIPGCPTGACQFNDEGLMTADRSKCVACGICAAVCPVDARTVMGKRLTVDEVMAEVRKDKNFYAHSEGGVTISGGDPVGQPGFTIEILKACRAEGIHTTIETSAYTSWETFREILEHTDLVYMDIKCMDPALHERCTGVSNERILENAVNTAKIRPMLVRTPVIPGFNDNAGELRSIALFARDQMGQKRIELLKFNGLCESKYVRLDQKYENHCVDSDSRLEARMAEFRTMVDEVFRQT